MYGLIVKLVIASGRRGEMIGILKEGSANMPGCLSYVLAEDSADENAIWATEVWDSLGSHEASLSLPTVQNVIPRANQIVSSLEKIAVTSPVFGVAR